MTSAAAVTVVVNPVAGRGKAAKLIPGVRKALDRAGISHRLLLSSGPDDPERMARDAAAHGADVVAALGGDGLVGMIVNGLMGTPTALAVIPGGNGNDFARGLGLDRRHPVLSVDLLRSPRFRSIDTVEVTTDEARRFYVSVAGAGFDSAVNETANRMKSRLTGTARYVAAVVATLREFKPAGFRIDVGDGPVSIEAMMVAVGNGQSYGGGMRVCPGADLGDGSVEVCIVGAMGKLEFLWNFPKVFRGTHATHPKVTMLRGTTVEIRSDHDAQVYADGEKVGSLPAEFRVLPGALKVVVP